MTALRVWRLSGEPFSMSLPEQVLLGLSFLAVLQWAFPHAALAQSFQSQNAPQLAFEIKEEKQSNWFLTGKDAAAEIGFENRVDPEKVEILRSYLAAKNSPLQDYAEVLLQQPNWKFILAISHAESNMCRRQLGNNCWGIGGVKYHRFYLSFAEGIVDANSLIQKYHDGGLNTAKKMMKRWVGWNNKNWIIATQNILSDLDNLGM